MTTVETQSELRRHDRPAVSARAIIIGIIGVIIVGVGFPYANMIIQATRPANTALPFGVIFIFLPIVFLLNPLWGLIRKKALLHRGELLVIFIMLLVAAAVPTWGLMGQLIPIMTGGTYYATPENRWEEQVLSNMPDWMVIKDPEIVRPFYEGLGMSGSIPWSAWVTPLAAWFIFAAGLYAATLGITLLYHRQWVDNERLVYPLMRLPIEMVGGVGDRRILSDFFSNRLMWIGFGLTFLMTSYLALTHYAHYLPHFRIRTQLDIPIKNENIGLRFWLNPSVSAFTYMIHTDLAFSLWFFSLFSQIENPAMRIMGVGLGAQEVYGAGTPAVSNQTMGAMIVLVLYGLYTARRPLGEIFSAAIEGRRLKEGSDLGASPQVIVGMIVFGFLTMGGWLYLGGLNIPAIIVFLFGAFVTFIALTRATVQGGVPVSRAALIPQSLTPSLLGSRFIGPAGIATLGATFAWSADIRVFMMPFTAHAAKLWSEIREEKRGFVTIFGIAVALSAGLATYMIITRGYYEGAVWLSSWLFTGCPQRAYQYAANFIQSPTGPMYSKLIFQGLGAGVMWLLTILHYQFPRWPLHPLGFAIGPTQPVVDLWFSIFLGWITKTTILHLGGYRAYRPCIMLFLGIILGQFTASGVWAIVDGAMQTTNNLIFVY
ncbi:MAG: DUF6785 family protein [Armatimonadota bacterium]